MATKCPRCGSDADVPNCPNCNGRSFHFGPLSDGSEGLICNQCNIARSHIACPQCGSLIPGIRFMSGAYQNLRDSRSGNCFIATELYGSGSVEVARLQSFRDQVLLRTAIGKAFVALYYQTSPKIIPLMRRSKLARFCFRIPVVCSLYWLRLTRFWRGN